MATKDLSAAEIKAIAVECYLDPVQFCRTMLPEWFPSDMPWVHRGILAILLRKTDFLLKYGELGKIITNFVYKNDYDDPKEALKPIFTINEHGHIDMVVSKYTLLMMPRGFSKTTLMNAAVLYKIVYKTRKFPFYLSESGPHASDQLTNVKTQLESNERLRKVYGNLVPNRQSSEKWTSDYIEPLNGVIVKAKGRGGQVRGQNVGAQRPDEFLIDDVEDDESVATVEQRKKARHWLYQVVEPALPKLDSTASIVAAGTLLHKDALLMTLARDPEWTTIIFGAIDRQGDPLWEANMSKADLEAKRQAFQRIGNLAGFYREYFNQLRDDESAKFKERYIRHGRPGEIVKKALVIDPAIGELNKKRTPDFCAFAVVGMTSEGRIAVLECWGKQGLTPREQIDRYFELHDEFELGPDDHHGVESNAYQAALVHLIQEEMFRKKTYFEVTKIFNAQKKLLRVEGILQPRYAAGYILHTKPFPILEQQLLDWPHDKLDFPDVLAMAVSLLDPQAAYAAGPDTNLAEDEYEPIELEYGDIWSAP